MDCVWACGIDKVEGLCRSWTDQKVVLIRQGVHALAIPSKTLSVWTARSMTGSASLAWAHSHKCPTLRR